MLKSLLRTLPVGGLSCRLLSTSSLSYHPETTGQVEEFEYQAETQRLLEIVTHSLYQNKEIFIRELISNASDALERRRQEELVVLPGDESSPGSGVGYSIDITLDTENDVFSITDTGIGMTKEEMEQYLGTICYSGSQAFQTQLSHEGENADLQQLIGQFGVGFYSVFMVADEVEVLSRSALDEEGEGWRWSTEAGSATYTIEAYPVDEIGTTVNLSLKPEHSHFGEPSIVEQIVKKYSHFVSFPLTLNETELPSLDALWTRPKDQISEAEHSEFYQYLSKNPYEKDPFLTIVFQTDMPIQIQSIFYIPPKSDENLLTQMLLAQAEEGGFEQGSSSVQLYSNKVLVSSSPGDVLPSWLRFVRGVVDSSDFPINVSRETFQDSNMLISRIQSIVTKKIISELKRVQKDDPKAYQEFYNEYERYIKEGITTDYLHMEKLADLLMVESALTGEKINLADYVNGMKEGQSEIYYLVGTARDQALSSPYIDRFTERGIDVLFSYTPVLDDFVFETLGEYSGYPFIRVDKALTSSSDPGMDKSNLDDSSTSVDSEELFKLQNWMEERFPLIVGQAETTYQLGKQSPAIVMNPESQTERMFKKMQGMETQMIPQRIAINPSNLLIQRLAKIVSENSEDLVAFEVMEQIIDNALVHAGLMDDPRVMINRMNNLLELMMEEYDPSEN